jgi:hypothetical protein
MTYETFRLIVYLIGVPIILYLLVMAVKRTRAVSQRIREVQEEAERTPTNPYADMARMFLDKDEAGSNGSPRMK